MLLNRSFAFVRYPPPNRTRENAANDYFVSSTAARKVVRSLSDVGVRTFLLIGAPPAECRVMGAAIQSAGLTFFTDERWTWTSALDEAGHFVSDKYARARVEPELLPLKAEFPQAFAGFHFFDEPGLAQLDALGSLRDCLRSYTAFDVMKIFLNLFPIHQNYAGLSGLARELATARDPSEYGVDCANDVLANMDAARLMARAYGIYVRAAAEKVRPDYLSFDLYPRTGYFVNCVAARELSVSENLSNVSNVAKVAAITPVAYLQNWKPKRDHIAYAHHLRWFISWSFAFGVHEFANFISHDGERDEKLAYDQGLLDSHNEATRLAGEQRSAFEFMKYLQRELAELTYGRFVAPFLGVSSGDVVGWLPSSDLLAGEYSGVPGQVVVFFARRPFDGPTEAQVGLNRWYTGVEELDLASGQWNTIAQSTNAIDVSLTDLPGALYRLTE